MPIEHVVQFSGGVCSFWAAKRVIERFGSDNVVLLFADTCMEDEDLYRFLRDAEAHLGVKVTRIADGRTPWQVFYDERFLGNSRIDPCSKILKRDLLWKWMKENALTGVVYVGLEESEENRLIRLCKRMPEWRIESPVMWDPSMDKLEMLQGLKALGIEIPRLYNLGYSHNNCQGFCVKAGQAQFRLLLQTMPERYAWHEAQEQKLREFLGKDVAIMKDRRGGQKRPMTMKEFRERIEHGEEHERGDWGGCGCAVE